MDEGAEEYNFSEDLWFSDPRYTDNPSAIGRADTTSTEEWLLSFFPDILQPNYTGEDPWQGGEQDLDGVDRRWMMIADREAMVTGWLLVGAVNHKGESLGRIRIPAGRDLQDIIVRRESLAHSFEESTGVKRGELKWFVVGQDGFTRLVDERPSQRAPGFETVN